MNSYVSIFQNDSSLEMEQDAEFLLHLEKLESTLISYLVSKFVPIEVGINSLYLVNLKGQHVLDLSNLAFKVPKRSSIILTCMIKFGGIA